jgi:hypothetical protein
VEKLRTSLRKALVWVIAIMAGACQIENTGSIRKSPEVGQAFESLQLEALHGYRFFFLNQENNPFGVAGLQKGYWMQGPDWKEVNPDSPTFGKVVGLVQSFPAQGGRTEGYTILDRQGRQIGVWYSSLSAGITVDPDSKQVMISTATPWLQQ